MLTDEEQEQLRKHEVSRGGGHQPIETNAPRVPPSSSVTEIVPDGIPIGQRPAKPCDHDYDFLRNCAVYEDPAVTIGALAREVGRVDVFYCRRCLEYREVQR